MTMQFVVGKGECYIIIIRLRHPCVCHFYFSFILGGLNFSSSLPDNRTIKAFVEEYVDKLISGYPVAYQTMHF